MKKLSGGVRTALAQYRELAAFSQFASDLDDATKAQLARGIRITELIKQKQYAPMSVAQQSLSIFAADRGYMDDVDVEKIGSFEEALHGYFTRKRLILKKALMIQATEMMILKNNSLRLLSNLKKPKLFNLINNG